MIALSGVTRVGFGWQARAGPARRWALWAGLCVAAAFAAAVVIGASPAAAICAAVLVGAATVLGWRLGEDTRAALKREIDGRSGELEHALAELENAQAETVRRLAMAVEFRDEDTGAHIERIGRLSGLLAEQIGMDEEFCARLRYAAPLHDVGKVAIPDAILLKPGPLTPEERAIVETHAEEGHRLVGGSSSSILDLAATIALSHQEKWDGSGYPRGLAGEEIPLEGRIVAVADVFDALTSDRVYRKAFSVKEAVRMMRAERGRHFDPDSARCLHGDHRQGGRRRARYLRKPSRSRSCRARARSTPARFSAATPSWPRKRSRERSKKACLRGRCTPR